MKRTLLGLFFCGIFGSTQAATLNISDPLAMTFSGYDGQPLTVTGAESHGSFGSLSTTSAGTFYATYLGNESSYNNSFSLGAGATLTEASLLGATISKAVSAGIVGFSFSDSVGFTFSNGTAQTSVLGYTILPGQSNPYGTFDYVLGFNDSAKVDADYDDYVVGVRFVATPVPFVATPVPEPETYAMLLAGLGLMGIVTRRRKFCSK